MEEQQPQLNGGTQESSDCYHHHIPPHHHRGGGNNNHRRRTRRYNNNNNNNNNNNREPCTSVKLRQLFYVLRHGAPKLGVPIGPGGYALIDDLLALPMFSMLNSEQIVNLAHCSNKALQVDDEMNRIRACEWHSFEIDDPECTLRAPFNPGSIKFAYYDMAKETWLNIVQHQGIHHMRATHIHFHVPGWTTHEAKKAIRVQLDVEAAMRDGYSFEVTINGYLICRGNQFGVMPPQYLTPIMDMGVSGGEN